MKYVVIRTNDGMDTFTDEFNTLDEAIEYADAEYDRMTSYDKKHTTEFCIIESENPDEDAEDHLDGTLMNVYI